MTAEKIFKHLKITKTIPFEDDLKIAFPCLFAKLVSVDKVMYNEYNPNNVAPPEMRLLNHSINEDGYTQPIVTYYEESKDIYHVVDGAHRYKLALKMKLPFVPIVVINKNMKDRIASTIRHNRARGEHGVDRMGNIVAELVKLGWTDEEISKHLGMDADEVLRLKQNTGLAEIFKEYEYSKSWI